MKNEEQAKPLLCRIKTTISVKTNGKTFKESKTIGVVNEDGDKQLQKELIENFRSICKEELRTSKELRQSLNIQENSRVRIYISVKTLECDGIFEI